MSKKRGLSPSGSSRSSATPVPIATVSVTSSLNLSLHPPSSPHEGFGAPGPSRLSSSSTPAPAQSVERATARHGVPVPGSGDGTDYGEECFMWEGLPMNKQAFRYAPCGQSPTPSPSLRHTFYRTIPYAAPIPSVHISWLDRSSFLRLAPSALTASTDRGYRAARANISVREGSWYYEVIVERGNGSSGAGKGSAGDSGNAHVRVGWGRREASLDAPVGSDGYSYGIRDVGGEKLHLSRPKPYGQSFATGDVVGCVITLPPRPEPTRGHDPSNPSQIHRRRVPIHYKGQWYFEMHEYTPIKEMEALIDREGKLAAATKAAEEAAKEVEVNGPKAPKKKATTKNAKKGKTTVQEASKPVSRHLPRLPGSSVSFFLNGEPLGEAFNGLYDFVPLPPIAPPTAKKHPALFDPQRDVLHDDGTLGYYPMISCFGRGKVRCNFGPEWVKPPRDLAARPMSERWDEFREEERILDEADETEAAVKIVKEEERVRAITQLETGGRKAKSSSKRKKGTATPTPAPDGFGDRDGTPRSDVLDGLPVKIEMESAAPTPRGSSRAGSVVSAGTVEVVLKDEKMESEEGVNWG